ncbi:MAG: ATP-binding protein, partial [Atopobiaceae bacterium]|nr:ATP-binding protein [Atopobiaceae bacterium]
MGKSTIVSEFGRNEYRSCIVIDFFEATEELKRDFRDLAGDLDTLFLQIMARYGTTLYERESLIVFDEVQCFPFARGMIKYLVADGRYDYIETGSLLSIRQNVADIVIPSEEHSVALEPMDFEEFLWAMGEEPLARLISSSFERLRPLPDDLHRKAMRLFREYLLVGGMPEVVNGYVRTRDFALADAAKRQILELYRNDVGKYAGAAQYRVANVFDAIPGQLSKHEKRFVLSSISKDARMRTYEEAFFWLGDARIANIAYASTDPSVGLGLSSEHATLKCYLADTGLLVSLAFPDMGLEPGSVYQQVLLGGLGVNEGMLVENVVAQQLVASGHSLFFYSSFDRKDSSNRMEVDFLVVRPYPNAAMKPRVSPVEVKSPRQYSTVSLDKF